MDVADDLKHSIFLCVYIGVYIPRAYFCIEDEATRISGINDLAFSALAC